MFKMNLTFDMDVMRHYRWQFIRGVKLTTHLRLVQRSKNGWSCTSTSPIRLHGVVLS